VLACVCIAMAAVSARAQENPATSAPAAQQDASPALTHRPAEQPLTSPTVALTVPKGTPIQVALDKEVRIEKVGQPVRGHVVEPVYAFDKLVIPAGSEVTGQIAKIEHVSTGKRVMSALDADFTPVHKVEVEFNQINLANGTRIPIQTKVIPGSGQVIEFVSATDENQKKGVMDAAAAKTKEAKQQAKQQAKQEWNNAMSQVKAPGKIHRIERFAVAQLPAHPQYIDAGTVYFAELQEPLDFGTEPLTTQMASSIGAPPADGSVVQARLMTPLSSATAKKGDEVEAVVSRPLFDGDRLILPQGSFLKGSVVQVQPAHRPDKNGQLRLVFHDLILPEGVEQKVEASLAGVEAAKADNVKLDSEGGAQATSPKTRYLNAGVSIGLAALSFRGDPDAKTPNPAGTTGNRIAGGAVGFKAVGIVMGVLVHSRAFGYSMGAYGAGMSVYTNFIARGHDVVFPKDSAMTIGIGTRPPEGAPAANPAAQPDSPAPSPAKPLGE
jgi:type IV secretory pathway VirB10-like protein